MIDADKLRSYLALMSAANLMGQAADRQLKADGDVTLAQFEILAALSRNPDGLRMTDLASQVVSSRSGLTYQVSQLETAGLVSRQKARDGDPRTVFAVLTAAGQAVVERLYPTHIALIEENYFSRISVDEACAISAVLGRIAARLRKKSVKVL